MVRIEILAGPEAGRVVEFGPGTHRLGRTKDNDLVLPVDSVSGKHLELQVEAGGTVRFRDLGSTNGTFSGGAQVKEGEWFAGSELRLGGCALRLLAEGESGMLEEAAAEGRDAARAREAALSAKRSPLPLLLGAVAVLAAAGAGGWWFFLRGGDPDAPRRGPAAAADGGAAPQQTDLLAGLGDFADAEAWSLGEGATLRDGALVAGGGRTRAALLRSFPVEGGGVRLAAQVGGGARARAWISFGEDEDSAAPLATWCAGELAAGAQLRLPASARWFKLALTVEGSGSVRDLRADPFEGSVTAENVPAGTLFLEGGNLLLRSSGAVLLSAAATAGSWSRREGGLNWSGGGELNLVPGPAMLADGPALVLAAGGPAALSPGLRVEQSPGLLLGGDLRRLMAAHEPATWTAVDGGLRAEPAGPVALVWELGPALTEAARLAQEIRNATRDGDDARLLAVAAKLLREYPMDETRMQAARDAQRQALERGRARLAALQQQVASAIFVGAVDPMEPLAARAGELAGAFAGTPLGEEAAGLAGALRGALEAGRAAEREEELAWRERLLAALRGAYPAVAAWVEERG